MNNTNNVFFFVKQITPLLSLHVIYISFPITSYVLADILIPESAICSKIHVVIESVSFPAIS